MFLENDTEMNVVNIRRKNEIELMNYCKRKYFSSLCSHILYPISWVCVYPKRAKHFSSRVTDYKDNSSPNSVNIFSPFWQLLGNEKLL